MDDLFLVLMLISFKALFVGLIKPSTVIKWGEIRDKKKVLYTYIPAILIFFILFGVTAPTQIGNEQKSDNQVQTKVGTTQKSVEVTTPETDATNTQPNETTLNIDNNVVNGKLKVHYINVGQADSILIQNETHAMLIDAGNNDDGSLVVNYLKQKGVKELDYLVGTHPHEDHIGGLDNVINSFPIGNSVFA